MRLALSPLLLAFLLLAAPPRAQDPAPDLASLRAWRVDGGRLLLAFPPTRLEALGLELRELQETAVSPDAGALWLDSLPLAFAVAPGADLRVLRNADARYQPYGVLDGALAVRGGFTLASPASGRAVDLHGLQLHARWARSDGPGGEPDADVLFLAPAGTASGGLGPDDLVKLCYPKLLFEAPGLYAGGDDGAGAGDADGSGADDAPSPGWGHDEAGLAVRAFDLVVTARLAEQLGRPDLDGALLGHGELLAHARLDDSPWQLPPGQNVLSPWIGSGGSGSGSGSGGGGGGAGAGPEAASVGAGLDLQLGGLQGLVVLGHQGRFPSGRTGLSLTTTACNVGTVEIPWQAAMQTGHPGISMALYREQGGRFEQIGLSWMKHGFFAQSNSFCVPCSGTTDGTRLGIGCSDTYGSSTNGNRFWLGPRAEWNAFTATWDCEGSYFDGLPVDCVRDEDGAGLDPVSHRLQAADADLASAGASYFYEAAYLVPGDVELANNIGWRRCTFSLQGQEFSASTPAPADGNPLVLGPAVLRWGQKRTIAGLEPLDGRVVLAAQVTPLAGGLFRYEYALYNWTLHAQVSSFALPLASGLAADRSFHDVDGLPANDWGSVKQGGNLRWSWNGVVLPGDIVAGPLAFGMLDNFGFTCDRPPAVRDALLTLHAPGDGPALLAVETLGPAGLALGADPPSPPAGGSVRLEVVGGTAAGGAPSDGTGGPPAGGSGGPTHAVLLAVALDGLALPQPIVLAPGLLPLVGGEAQLDVVVPLGLAGTEIALLAVEVSAALDVVAVSNEALLVIRPPGAPLADRAP